MRLEVIVLIRVAHLASESTAFRLHWLLDSWELALPNEVSNVLWLQIQYLTWLLNLRFFVVFFSTSDKFCKYVCLTEDYRGLCFADKSVFWRDFWFCFPSPLPPTCPSIYSHSNESEPINFIFNNSIDSRAFISIYKSIRFAALEYSLGCCFFSSCQASMTFLRSDWVSEKRENVNQITMLLVSVSWFQKNFFNDWYEWSIGWLLFESIGSLLTFVVWTNFFCNKKFTTFLKKKKKQGKNVDYKLW